MPLTGFPLIPKYANGDSVYVWLDNEINFLTISGWEVLVDDPAGDDTGRQTVYYTFAEKGTLLVEESRVFSSANHIGSWIKNDYINRAIEEGDNGSSVFKSPGLAEDDSELSMGNWTDFAGWDLSSANLKPETEDVIMQTDELIFDGANLTGATLPDDIDTKSEFKAAVKSYDAETTIWTDGDPIGR